MLDLEENLPDRKTMAFVALLYYSAGSEHRDGQAGIVCWIGPDYVAVGTGLEKNEEAKRTSDAQNGVGTAGTKLELGGVVVVEPFQGEVSCFLLLLFTDGWRKTRTKLF